MRGSAESSCSYLRRAEVKRRAVTNRLHSAASRLRRSAPELPRPVPHGFTALIRMRYRKVGPTSGSGASAFSIQRTPGNGETDHASRSIEKPAAARNRR